MASTGPQNDGMCSIHTAQCIVTGAVCAQQRDELPERDIDLQHSFEYSLHSGVLGKSTWAECVPHTAAALAGAVAGAAQVEEAAAQVLQRGAVGAWLQWRPRQHLALRVPSSPAQSCTSTSTTLCPRHLCSLHPP